MEESNTTHLAIKGGQPISESESWPSWPLFSKTLLLDFEKVLESKRWTISSNVTEQETFEEQFCRRFAEYNGTQYALTTDHGSSAILLALQSLGITYGDEVIIPGLTWVACATAVLRANAVPILADIEESTQCISPEEVEKLINPKTKAILVVHLYSCMANMDKFLLISQKYNIPIIEDCSQVHGSTWNDKKAGSIGLIGVFSMQQGKLLTCGEGGAIITNDKSIYEKLILLKNDGRKIGKQYLEEDGSVIGANFALSEFQAAILCERLSYLADQNALREENANYLSALLETIPGLKSVKAYPQNNHRSYYHFSIRYDKSFFCKKNVWKVCEALSKELGLCIHPAYVPFNKFKLFRPQDDPRYNFLNLPDYTKNNLPESEMQFESSILIHHSALLATREKMGEIYDAFKKTQEFSFEL